jgi:DNA-binding response OmpR family regulator
MSNENAAPRLLVVDDVEENREILRRRFSKLGYHITEAEDGETALAKIEAEGFDCVLLDVMMPGIDGLEVLRRVRQTMTEAQLPVIMVTAKSASEDVVEALLMGANDYITKPVDMEVAGARVEMQLRRKRAEDAAATAYRELEQTLEGLQGAVNEAENKAAVLSELEPEVRAPLDGLLGAAKVLTRICDTPDLNKMVSVIEGAAASLDRLVADALLEEERPERRTPRPNSRIHVLSADNDPTRRQATRMVFAEAEVEIELSEAHTGGEAAAMAKAGFFDLILMNAELPDGLDGVREIRRAEAGGKKRRTPVLAVSRDGAAAAKAMECGCDLHMPAPITAAGLLTALARALSRESEDLSAVA